MNFELQQEFRDQKPLLGSTEDRSINHLHRVVETKLLSELIHELGPDNLDWIGVLEEGERFGIQNYMTDEAEEELDHSVVPDEVTRVEHTIEHLLLWIMWMELNAMAN